MNDTNSQALEPDTPSVVTIEIMPRPRKTGTDNTFHRRASFFGRTENGAGLVAPFLDSAIESESCPTEEDPGNETSTSGLADALADHIQSTKNQLQCMPYTLDFVDNVDEELYTEFTGSVSLKSWLMLGLATIVVLIGLQTVMAFTLLQSPTFHEFYLGLIVYLPLLSILGFIAFSPYDEGCKSLQLATLAYVIVAGPVFIIGRAWLIQGNINNFALSPVYITIIYATSYLLGLRFIYSLLVAVISISAWVGLATVSYVYEIKQPGLSSALIFGSKANFIWTIISIIISMFIMCTLAYTIEWNSRLQFLSNQQLIIFNSKLQSQLKGLESTYSNTLADLESPLEKAIANVKLLLASSRINGTQIRILHEILGCLNSSHLMAPDLLAQVTSGGVLIDKEEKKWLLNELVRSQKDSNTLHDYPEEVEPSVGSSSKEKKPSSILDYTRIDILQLHTPQVTACLSKMNEYNFAIFEFDTATRNNPLLVFSHELVVKGGLLERLKMPVSKFLNFMKSIEAGYRKDLSYHNSIHAADVLHGINYLCRLGKIKGIFTDLEQLSLYIAAAIHDYDHPGVNNNFLIATRDPIALVYNDKSVLENHHCSNAFKVLLEPHNFFVEPLDKKSFNTFRAEVVDMVLATDLAQHFDLLTMFKKKVVTAGAFDPFSSQDDRSILMQMLIKCSDVSSPTKEWPIYQEWITRIMTEFYIQGDLERQMGIPVSPFMNRDMPGQGAQKGFIEYIVYPLFEALESWTTINEIKFHLNQSRDRFCHDGGNAGANTKGTRKNLKQLKTDMNVFDSARSPADDVLSAGSPSVGGGNTYRRASVVATIRSQSYHSISKPHTHSHSNSIAATGILARSTNAADNNLPRDIIHEMDEVVPESSASK